VNSDVRSQIVVDQAAMFAVLLCAFLAFPEAWQSVAALTLWAHGWSYREIARALHRSPATAWRCVHDLKRRLGSKHVT